MGIISLLLKRFTVPTKRIASYRNGDRHQFTSEILSIPDDLHSDQIEKLEVSEESMEVPLSTIKFIIESGKFDCAGEKSSATILELENKFEPKISYAMTDSINQSLIQHAVETLPGLEEDRNEKNKIAKVSGYSDSNDWTQVQPVDETLVESRPTPDITDKTEEGPDNSNSILPICPLPMDGDQVAIGSGITKKVLGRGGMGVVYLQWVKELEGYRALKILTPPAQAQDVKEFLKMKNRFFREGKVQSNLHHTNIAHIYQIGEWINYPFIEMEYIEGANLSTLIYKSGKFDPLVAIAVITLVLRGLRHAHTRTYQIEGKKYKGLIHRDLKPGNVMITKEGEPKILDFGIAIPFGMESITQQSGIVGTLLYCSPEQINGYDLDQRSDIYSVGVILYELITGTQPFGNQGSLQTILNSILNGNYRQLDKQKSKIPKSIKYIITKSMDVNPVKRFQSAEEMHDMCMYALQEISKETPEALVQKYVHDINFLDATRLLSSTQIHADRS